MLHSGRRAFASPAKCALHLLILFALTLGSLPGAAPVRAEGSRNVDESRGYRAHLEFHALASSAGIPRQTTVKAFAQPGETIYIGSSAMGVGKGDVVIRGPNDVTPARLWVDGRPGDPGARRCTTRAGGSPTYGRILNRAQEVAGPLPAAGGFTPCVISAAETAAAGAGIWEFDFISPNPDSGLPIPDDPDPIPVDAEWAGRPNDATGHWISAWDVSVRNTDAGADAEVPGRVFANYLPLNLGANASPALPDMGLFNTFYIQTYDGYGYLADMNGIDPFAFIFFANAEGIVDQAGLPIYRSVQLVGSNADQALPTDARGRPIYRLHNPSRPDNFANRDVTHKIFLDGGGPAPDLPAEAASPSGRTWLLRAPEPPPQPAGIAYTGEEGTPGQGGTSPLGGYFSFDSNKDATYQITIDLNGDGQFGTGNDRVLSGPATAGANRVFWDGLDGNRAKVPAGSIPFNAQLVFLVGEVHFPFIDAENHVNGHRLSRVVDAGGTGAPDASLVYYDDRYKYTATTGYDWSICANGQRPPPPASSGIVGDACYGRALDGRSALNGTPSIAPGIPGAHRWGPARSGYGDRRMIDTWTYYPSTPAEFRSVLTLAEAELAIAKTHSPPVLTPGGPVTYSVVVTNGGPSAAVEARVRDSVPPQVLSVTWACAVTRGTGSCGAASGSGNEINTTVDLSPDSAITYTILGTVDPDTEQSISNAASVRRPRDNTDPNPNNNDVINTAPVALIADLELNKTLLTTPPLTAGGVIDFAIVLRNRGPSRATGVTVADRLPAGLTFVSASPDKGAYSAATGVWDVGTMLRDEVATLTLRARWDGSAVTNTAEVLSSDRPDPDSAPGNGAPGEDDQDSVPIPALVADLALNKVVNVDRVNVGGNVTFTVELTNQGPDGATGVSVRDRLPAGLSFVRAAASQGSYNPTSGRWDVGSLAAGARATLTIEVTVLGPGPFANTAQVSSSDQYDPDSAPNNDDPREDDQGFAVVRGDTADLSITKLVDNPTPTFGDVITYTVTLRNGGPSTATGVAVTDRLPEGLQYIAHSASQGLYDPTSGTWAVGTVQSGANATLTLRARVQSFARIVNTAEVSDSDQPDPDSTPGKGDPGEDDQSSVPLSPQVADLELTKRASTSGPLPGERFSFTVELTNNGPSAASGVQVREQLPPGLTYVSHTVAPAVAANSYSPASGIWNLGVVEVGEAFTLTLQVEMGGPGPFTNTAEVSAADQYDPDSIPGNGVAAEDDQGSATVRSPIADLSVSKRSAGPRPNTLNQVTYTVGVHNAGPAPATGVRVAERLPAGSTLLATTPSQGSFAGGEWDVGSLAVGQTALLTLTVQLGGPGPHVNTAEVSDSDLPDPDSTPGNNDPSEDDQSSVTVPANVIDLELVKSVVALPKLERGVLFAIDLTNRGPDPASGVEVEDRLPGELRLISAAPSRGAYDPATGRWVVGNLAVDETVRLLIAATIEAAPSTEIVNFAQVARANEHDADSTPNNRPLPPARGEPPAEDDESAVYFSLLTPVTLKGFTATVTPGGVRLAWQTGTELDSAGFYLYRSAEGTRATATRITPSMLAATGEGAGGASYSHLDTGAAPGRRYSYWLVEVSRGGALTEHGPVVAAALAPRVWLPLLGR